MHKATNTHTTVYRIVIHNLNQCRKATLKRSVSLSKDSTIVLLSLFSSGKFVNKFNYRYNYNYGVFSGWGIRAENSLCERIDIVGVTKKLISPASAFTSNYLKTDCACHSSPVYLQIVTSLSPSCLVHLPSFKLIHIVFIATCKFCRLVYNCVSQCFTDWVLNHFFIHLLLGGRHGNVKKIIYNFI